MIRKPCRCGVAWASQPIALVMASSSLAAAARWSGCAMCFGFDGLSLRDLRLERADGPSLFDRAPGEDAPAVVVGFGEQGLSVALREHAGVDHLDYWVGKFEQADGVCDVRAAAAEAFRQDAGGQPEVVEQGGERSCLLTGARALFEPCGIRRIGDSRSPLGSGRKRPAMSCEQTRPDCESQPSPVGRRLRRAVRSRARSAQGPAILRWRPRRHQLTRRRSGPASPEIPTTRMATALRARCRSKKARCDYCCRRSRAAVSDSPIASIEAAANSAEELSGEPWSRVSSWVRDCDRPLAS